MPKTANEEFFDALTRHNIYTQRYSAGIANRINALLAKTEEDLAMRIRDKLRNSKGLTTPVEWLRLQALLKSISTLRGEAWDKAYKDIAEELTQFAYKEPIFISDAIKASVPVVIETVLPTARMLKSIALSRPFQGKILKDWAATMKREDLANIANAIQLGMTEGQSNEQIARRVIGTKAANFTDGVTDMSRTQVNRVVRTAVQHVANGARNELFLENADIVEEERFVATLDGRTTPVCRANDGKIFLLGKGPLPPLHYQCRSLRIAWFGEALGKRPAKPVTEKQLLREFGEENKLGNLKNRDAIPRGMKSKYDAFSRKRIRELTGPIPAETTYQKWMEGQSKEFQEDVMGKTKAQLFRDGKLPLDRFVDVNGQELTLSELAKRDADAFISAGLDPADFN